MITPTTTPDKRTKRCGDCGCDKDPSDFCKDSRRSDSLSPYCRDCTKGRRKRYNETHPESQERNRERARAWAAANREAARTRSKAYYHADKDRTRNRALLKNYGICLDEYKQRYKKQAGRCAICGCARPVSGPTSLNVDHDHASGTVRGLLCPNCNRAVGLLHDNPDTLRAAADYLEQR